MSKCRRIGFIVEGEKTELQIIENMKSYFFNDTNFPKVHFDIIVLPFGFNVYKLWKSICEYDINDSDIIDIMKEIIGKKRKDMTKLDNVSKDYFSELYLFFDYDGHAPIKKGLNRDLIIKEVLNVFDNETENGKLLLSYPMVEAVNGMLEDNICSRPELCQSLIGVGKDYKRISESGCIVSNFSFTKDDWECILSCFTKKMSCLFKCNVTYTDYRKEVSPISIFDKQNFQYIKNHNKVMILSAFPEFLLDYFEESFWQERQLESMAIHVCRGTETTI